MGKPRVTSLLLAALMLCLTALPASAAESATAAAIQLMKTEGTVNVTNSSGRSLTMRDNMRLYNGYHVETKAKSYAWINLDDTKLIKLDAVSETEVRKSGKALELLLSSGSFFFNVSSPLKEGETLNIRTATMVVGIRGTSGWFKAVDRWSTEIYVLEGTVQCSVSDPVTGEAKEATIQSGEMAVATAYPQDYEGDKCDIVQERFEPSDIDGFVLEELARDPGLCADIFAKSGLDVQSAVEATQERREQDEQKMKDTLDSIENQLTDQDNGSSAGAVWDREDPPVEHPPADNPPAENPPADDPPAESPPEENPPAENPPAENPPEVNPPAENPPAENPPEVNPPAEYPPVESPPEENPPSDEPTGPFVKLTMPQTAGQIQEALLKNGVEEVMLQNNSGESDSALIIGIDMRIPETVSLNISVGIKVIIQSGSTVTVKGSLLVNDGIENNGRLHIVGDGKLITSEITGSGEIIDDRTPPKEPGDIVPEEPDGTVPDEPDGTVPDEPDSTVPGEPDDTVPDEPDSTVPDEPGEDVPPEDDTPSDEDGRTGSGESDTAAG